MRAPCLDSHLNKGRTRMGLVSENELFQQIELM